MTKYQPVEVSAFGVPTAVTKSTFTTQQKAQDYINENPHKFRSGRATIIPVIDLENLAKPGKAAKTAKKTTTKKPAANKARRKKVVTK